MTPRELRAAAPKPASALPYLRLMIEYRKALARAIARDLSVSLRADDQTVIISRFANLETSIGRMTHSSELAAKLKAIAEGVQEHVKGELAEVHRVEISPAQRAQSDAFVQENVRLIKKMSYEQVTRMRNLTAQSVQEQWTQKELKAKIQEDFGFSKARSELIARDQTLRFNSETREQISKEAGITRGKWLTSEDERVRGTPGGKWPRGEHYHLNGQMFDFNNPPIVDKKTGRRALPGRDFQCRCTWVDDTDHLLFGD